MIPLNIRTVVLCSLVSFQAAIMMTFDSVQEFLSAYRYAIHGIKPTYRKKPVVAAKRGALAWLNRFIPYEMLREKRTAIIDFTVKLMKSGGLIGAISAMSWMQFTGFFISMMVGLYLALSSGRVILRLVSGAICLLWVVSRGILLSMVVRVGVFTNFYEQGTEGNLKIDPLCAGCCSFSP